MASYHIDTYTIGFSLVASPSLQMVQKSASANHEGYDDDEEEDTDGKEGVPTHEKGLSLILLQLNLQKQKKINKTKMKLLTTKTKTETPIHM